MRLPSREMPIFSSISAWVIYVAHSTRRGGADYDVEGIKWIRKAAKQGHARAQFRLGNEYESGQNIQQDYAEAERWHRKAAKQGDTDAQERLRKLNAANH